MLEISGVFWNESLFTHSQTIHFRSRPQYSHLSFDTTPLQESSEQITGS